MQAAAHVVLDLNKHDGSASRDDLESHLQAREHKLCIAISTFYCSLRCLCADVSRFAARVATRSLNGESHKSVCHRLVVLPSSPWLALWDGIACALFFYDLLMIPLCVFVPPKTRVIHILE